MKTRYLEGRLSRSGCCPRCFMERFGAESETCSFGRLVFFAFACVLETVTPLAGSERIVMLTYVTCAVCRRW